MILIQSVLFVCYFSSLTFASHPSRAWGKLQVSQHADLSPILFNKPLLNVLALSYIQVQVYCCLQNRDMDRHSCQQQMDSTICRPTGITSESQAWR